MPASRSGFGNTQFSLSSGNDNNGNNNNNNNNNNNGQTENKDNGNENDNVDDDNFNDIVSVGKHEISARHENEIKLGCVRFRKVYHFGKDVTGVQTWNDRASNSKLFFYQSKLDGKVRIVVRNPQNQKLRLNQYILPQNEANLAASPNAKGIFYTWTGYDESIINEENLTQDQIRPILFAIKFFDQENAQKFEKMFTNCEKVIKPFN